METIKSESVDDYIIVNPKTEIDIDDNFDISATDEENSNEIPAEFVEFPDTIEVTARTDHIEIAEGGVVIDREAASPVSEDNDQSSKKILEKLPRPVHGLNCRQARTYLVKLLRMSNGGLNPQYGNPGSKPPFWPDYYWPWERLTDVHTKPRGMEEPLLYSEMMKIAIERGYKYYGYDPDTYWDKSIEESEPNPVSRGTPAPIQQSQVERLGLPPKLPRPLVQLNCVQARTVLSKLLRYQQAGNNPVYGHPDTQPPWWPDECIRWIDMVDLRGKPPYLPKNMSYTDVLKKAIANGLKYHGFEADSWVDDQVYNKEVTTSTTNKPSKPNVQTMRFDSLPKLPIPISKMNCSVARTSLARLLRYHCGSNPKYGDPASMPVWWPNDSFEWAKLKNLSHRFDGFMGDSYSNCLRLAVACGYEFYGKDPMLFVEDPGEDLPSVSMRKTSTDNNKVPTHNLMNLTDTNMSELVKRLDTVIESNIVESCKYGGNLSSASSQKDAVMPPGFKLMPIPDFLIESDRLCKPEVDASISETEPPPAKRKRRPPPPLIPISAVKSYAATGSADISLLQDLGIRDSAENGS
eukprot:TRINITY_DN1266_c0_g1_i1.p1 TRINITY_DN1266_c0_g1~~TRINITY_DN1266_c0_g1_i1.p1  ORF type:complete len:578 (+),score=109.81 TRINITY_DN1266_c0_g1_i1:119-1852(+)